MCETIEYKSDCFDDRICDDLSQLLLSYLSIKDKIHFQCVSAQFRNSIIEKQKQFVLKDFLITHKSIGLLFLSEKRIKALESVLKMFEFINYIDISYESYTWISSGDFIDLRKQFPEIIEFVTKHCKQLIEIRFDINSVDQYLITSFGQKFGQSLQRIDFCSDSYDIYNQQIVIKLCPNLISIKNISLNAFSVNNQIIVLKKLKHINGLRIGENNQLIEDFFNKYKEMIESLDLKFGSSYGKNNLLFGFKQISKLRNLKKLRFMYGLSQYFDEIIKSLEEITQQCSQINSLSFDFSTDTSAQYRDVFKAIFGLKHLTELRLSLFTHNMENEEQIDFNLNCQSSDKIQNILHLTIGCNLLNDNFFTDMEKCFPKLKTIEINFSTKPLTDNTLYSLSKLENIEKISFGFGENCFTDKAILDLIKNCFKLRYISIRCQINNTTNETIDEIISLVSKRGKTEFVFKLNFGENNEYFKANVNHISNVELI